MMETCVDCRELFDLHDLSSCCDMWLCGQCGDAHAKEHYGPPAPEEDEP